MQVGQQAIAIGSPLGLEGGPSVTLGVISALDRTVDTHGGDAPLTGMIQTDASIAGRIVGRRRCSTRTARSSGITTAVAITESGTEGLGFAIPIEDAVASPNSSSPTARSRACWLGVRGADMSTGAEQDHGTDGGAMFREVDRRWSGRPPPGCRAAT